MKTFLLVLFSLSSLVTASPQTPKDVASMMQEKVSALSGKQFTWNVTEEFREPPCPPRLELTKSSVVAQIISPLKYCIKSFDADGRLAVKYVADGSGKCYITNYDFRENVIYESAAKVLSNVLIGLPVAYMAYDSKFFEDTKIKPLDSGLELTYWANSPDRGTAILDNSFSPIKIIEVVYRGTAAGKYNAIELTVDKNKVTRDAFLEKGELLQKLTWTLQEEKPLSKITEGDFVFDPEKDFATSLENIDGKRIDVKLSDIMGKPILFR